MKPRPIPAEQIPENPRKTVYPEPFAQQVQGRSKKKLGDHFGLVNFGVNLTRLEPGAVSALLHWHSRQDEMIYVLEGQPTLMIGEDAWPLRPGDCFGVRAGTGVAAQVINRSEASAVILEIGDRSAGDQVEYPNDDLKAELDDNGQWRFLHKDGRPYTSRDQEYPIQAAHLSADSRVVKT